MNFATQIQYYLRIAIQINKNSGGTRAYEAESNSRDRFVVIRDNVNKHFYYIKKKLQERDQRKGNIANINAEIKQKIEQIYSQLERMRQAVAAEKTSNAAQQLKYQLIEKLTTQTKQLQQLLETSGNLETKVHSRPTQTYTDMRTQLLDGGKEGRVVSKHKNNSGAPTEIQLTKMKKWQQIDRQIDDEIDTVLDGVKRWKDGLLKTGELIEQTDRKIVQLTEDVDKVNQDLFRSNKQLKGLVQKFRKPHKFCIDVVLVLILIALVVAAIKISSSN